MAQASLITTPFEAVKFPALKRARLSLKHRTEPPSEADICRSQDAMQIDNYVQEQDENVSPNVPEIGLSPYISDEAINESCKVSVVGLPNCGNTCYLNSILQVLRYTPNFLCTLQSLVSSQIWLAQISSKHNEGIESDFFYKLHQLYITMKHQEDFLYKNSQEDHSAVLFDHLQSFITSLGEISPLFTEGEQHDAHEFLLTLMLEFDVVSSGVVKDADACSQAQKAQNLSKGKRKINKRGKRPMKTESEDSCVKLPSFDLGFEGQMQHTVKCLECETRTHRSEPFTNLQVSIAEDFVFEETVDLQQCLEQRTLISGENKYFCEECYHLTEAQLSSEITSLPPILMLHCSWLRQSCFLNQIIEKDNTKVTIPLYLKTSENLNIFKTVTDETYCLYAIVLHVGASTDKGHYVAFIRASEITDYLSLNVRKSDNAQNCVNEEILDMKLSSKSNWLFFDDDNVLPLSLNDTTVFPYYKFMTISASPCIIFYYKK